MQRVWANREMEGKGESFPLFSLRGRRRRRRSM